MAAGALDGEFVGDVVDVVFGMLPVDVAEVEALGVAVHRLLEACTQGQQLVDALVGRHQPLDQRRVRQHVQRLGQVGLGEGEGLPLEADRVVLGQPLRQHILQDRRAQLAAAQRQRLGRRQIRPPQPHQQPQRGDLGDQCFAEGGRWGHGKSLSQYQHSAEILWVGQTLHQQFDSILSALWWVGHQRATAKFGEYRAALRRNITVTGARPMRPENSYR